MKKSNVIITVVLAAVSIFLLALWYMLGFNEIDSPLDLVISVVWCAVIVAGIAVAAKTESTRRQRIRTVYVADGAFYNSEAGNRILAVCNFTPNYWEKYRIGVPKAGVLMEVFNSDSFAYGGSGKGNGDRVIRTDDIPMHGHRYSVEITLPPL